MGAVENTVFVPEKVIRINSSIAPKSNRKFRDAFRKNGIKIDLWVDENMLDSIEYVFPEGDFELVVASAEDFGFTYDPTLTEIYRAAEVCGLSLCPHVFGPMVRLQYLDQPFSMTRLVLATEPIYSSSNVPYLFGFAHVTVREVLDLVRDNGDEDHHAALVLQHFLGNKDAVWSRRYRFLFWRKPPQ